MTAVLMYHSVGGHDRLAVTPAAFAAQMAHLYDHRYKPITFDQLARDPDGTAREHRIVLTFDDGYADFYDTALPVLRAFGFTATLFVTTGWLRDAGRHAAGHPVGRTLTWDQLSDIAEEGIEVGGHGHSHAQLDQLSEPGEEMRLNRELLEDRLGTTVTTMAYPYGYSSARVRRAAADAGYRAACAVANVPTRPGDDVFALPRLTVAASTSLSRFRRIADERGIPLIFMREHALTKVWAGVRRSRSALRRVGILD
jgi:peptidoglycan/xylan/chitin deacetylase (PgdA/CDA1 family)